MHLEYFKPHEFTRDGVAWFNQMNPRLLVLLDVFRHLLGRAVPISPHPRALGRPAWPNTGSDHAVDERGSVDAADVMLGNITGDQMRECVRLATSIGFTAIGVYPHWQPSAGMHLGIRPGRRMGAPATWGAVRKLNDQGQLAQVYVSLDEALGEFPT